MNRVLEREVWERAHSRCEYCRVSQEHDALSFEIDHIVAIKHRGPTDAENLALACFACNHHKGPNIAGIDPDTGEVTRLYHPRRDRWDEHFAWQGPLLTGRTPVGRATVAVLEMNVAHRVALRQQLLDEDVLSDS